MKPVFCVGLCAAFLFPSILLAKPDKPDTSDPIFPPGTTKHVSDWIKELRSDDEKSRQKGLVAMKLIGPKVPGVVAAVCGTLKQDKNADMRGDAALTRGHFAPPVTQT